jgi:hypothetical protein
MCLIFTRELALKREDVELSEVHVQKPLSARFTWSLRITILTVVALLGWGIAAAWATGMQWLGLAA